VSGLLWPLTGSCGETDGDRGAVRPAIRGGHGWLVGCATVTIAVFAGCATGPTASPTVGEGPGASIPTSAKPTPSPDGIQKSTPTQSFTLHQGCDQIVEQMTLSERIGQLLMVGVSSRGISDSEKTIVEETRAGSIILLGNTTAGKSAVRRVVSDVRTATRSPEGVRVMLATDQEGGRVQRLKGSGFATIPPARVQAKQSDAALRRNAHDWGTELKEAGINANLAPVADVVPMSMVWVNRPIGQLRRGYDSSPKKVAAKVTAFTEGMDRAGVATAVKHFPGLGRVRGNTDYVSRVVDTRTTRHDDALAGFSAAIDAGTDMVMVSSAFYRRIDAEHRAAFSTIVMEEMLREDLGFSGVVISDDLAAASMRVLPPEERARRFIRAGGDLLIVGDAQLATTMVDTMKREASDNPAFEKRVTNSATRVVAMKERRGLAHC
jgi:beta-N-acetylhexosaminidase